MPTDTKASALRAVWHYWQHLDDEEMKPLVVNLARNEGYTPQEVADAAGTTVEISESNLFPTDNITTSGIEGTVLQEPVMHRAVIGGTGIYRAASGELTQTNLGFNTSLLLDGSGDAAPNFRCQFDLFLMS